MKLNDVLFGEPEYDNEGNVIKRNMGLKNVLVWLFLFYVFQNYSFIRSTKQKGGAFGYGIGEGLEYRGGDIPMSEDSAPRANAGTEPAPGWLQRHAWDILAVGLLILLGVSVIGGILWEIQLNK